MFFLKRRQMKYIYYIIGILILISVGLTVRLSGLKVDVSEPALVINDKIISKTELDDLSKYGSYHSRGKDFIDSVITREILIQEALKAGIHKEEAFRKSVESFYEQSLIKVVVDRKFQELSPEVTEEMIATYKKMALSTVIFTKYIYDSEEGVQTGEASSTVKQEHSFENLSETLQFTLFMLEPGETSQPEETDEGYVVFRLDKISPNSAADGLQDDAQVKDFLIDQGKNAMFDSWMNEIRKNADIQILSQDTGK